MSTTITKGTTRINVKCDECHESIDAPNTAFGAHMADGYAKTHKCWKPRKAK